MLKFTVQGCTYCHRANFDLVHKNIQSAYSDGKYYEIRECSNCGLKYTFPEPEASILDKIYSEEYRFDLHRLFSTEKTYRAKRLLKSLNLTIETTSNLSALELGAGNCELSNTLNSDYGFKVTAVDRNVSGNNEIRVLNMSIESFLETQKSKFDYIFLSHTLEHLISFDVVFKRICHFLNFGGRIVIVVPNAIKRRKHWGYWAIPVHLYHFTEDFLKLLAANNDLQVESIDFKGIDSLGFLSGVSAKIGLQRNIAPSKSVIFVLKIFSLFFRFGYNFGDSDLVFVARKR